MKKTLSLLMVIMLVLGALAACGPNREEGAGNNNKQGGNDDTATDDANKPEKLVIWEDDKKSGWLDEVGAKFTEEYGIEIEVKEVEMATKMKEQLRLDGPAGTGPDVLTLPHDQIGEMALAGHIAELNVEQDVLDRFTESSILAQTYNGTIIWFPKSSETPVFIYNKDLMEEAPATMDEVYDFSKDFTKDGNYGFLALWDNFYFAHAPIGGIRRICFR